jgi:DNA repair protein SbcD/Mre11
MFGIMRLLCQIVDARWTLRNRQVKIGQPRLGQLLREPAKMRFTFLHAADLHLGSPFVGLAMRDEQLAARFARASRDAFSDLVSRVIEARVAFVVIAGDVYDGDWKDTSIGLFFNRELARLDRAGIPVYILKGNHDAESVITKAISLPPNVSQFPTKTATFRIEALNVALHGRSFPDRVVTENYVLDYPDPVPGWFNIGVLHTSCSGRPGHDTYAPCTVNQLQTLGYQYWALGHVHEYEELAWDPWIVFPGNLQGRSIRECGPKGAVLVEVDDGAVTEVRRLIVDRARWAIVNVDLDTVTSENEALAAFEQQVRQVATEADGRMLALRLTMTGTTALYRSLKADAQRFSEEAQAAAHRCAEDAWVEGVRFVGSERDMPTPSPMVATPLDFGATLAALQADPDVRAAAAGVIAEIVAKLPRGIKADDLLLDGSGLDALLDEVRSFVLTRTASEG